MLLDGEKRAIEVCRLRQETVKQVRGSSAAITPHSQHGLIETSTVVPREVPIDLQVR
jgi:hypothetical protein